MFRKKIILSIITCVISIAFAYWLLDASKLFYCINIGGLLVIVILLLLNTIRKIKWETIRKADISKLVFIVLFFVLISLPVVQQLTGFIKGSSMHPKLNEKRVLAKYPSIKNQDINNFPESYTDYYNDNFGLRNFLISNNNYFKTIHFGISSNDNVIIGKEGWMFFNSSNSLKDHLGEIKLTEKELFNIKKNLLARKDYLNKKGINYYICFFPDKMGVYKDMMPSKYKLVDSTRLDQLKAYLAGSGLEIIDVRNQMKNARDSGVHLYQKSDSHWNHNGGLVASTEIINTIKKDFPDLQSPYSVNDYEVKEEIKNQGGDLANLLGVKNYLNKRWFTYKLKQDPNPKIFKKVNEYQFYKEPYKATFTYSKPIKAPRLLVFNDSFISYVYSHLGDYFSRSNFFWTYDFRKDLIEKESPDIVLSLLVERQLQKLAKDPL